MNPYSSQLHLSGRTDRINQLAHLSLIDAANNTSIGVNVGYARGQRNTSVGAYSGLLDASSRDSVLLGARAGACAHTAIETVAVGARALANACVAVQSVFVGPNAGSHARRATLTTAIGHAAGSHLSTAARTTIVGALSGQFAFNSLDDTFVGYASGRLCREGARNAALGAFSGTRLETGEENVFIGFRAGANVETAERCVAVGAGALEHAANASNVIAIGTGAGRHAANARDAIFIGGWSSNASSSSSSSGAANNVIIGMNSGSGGADNVGVGTGVMPGVRGTDNVGIGTGAGAALDAGNSNVLVGSHAGANIANGQQNVAVGVRAGNAGSNNTSIGFGAGGGVTGENNTSVGKGAGPVGASFFNTAMGYNAAALLHGTDNVIVGAAAAQSGNAANNVIVGTRTALHVEGTRNIVVGADSFASLVGNNNVFVGTNDAWDKPVETSIIVGSNVDKDFDVTSLANAVIIGSDVTISKRDSDSLVLYNRALGDVVRASREAVTFGTGVLVTITEDELQGNKIVFMLQDTYYPNNSPFQPEENLPPFVVAEPDYTGVYGSFFGDYQPTAFQSLPGNGAALPMDYDGIYINDGLTYIFLNDGGYVNRWAPSITNDASAASDLWYGIKVFDTSWVPDGLDGAIDGFWGPRSLSLESTFDANANAYVIANVANVESDRIWADVLQTIPDQVTWRTYDVQPVRVQGLWYDKVRVHPSGIFAFCNDAAFGAPTSKSVAGPCLYFGADPLVMSQSYKLVVDSIIDAQRNVLDHIDNFGADVQLRIDYANCNKCTILRWEGFRASDYSQSQLLVMEMTLYYGNTENYTQTPSEGAPPTYVTQLESDGTVRDSFVRLAWSPRQWPFGSENTRPIYFGGVDSCRLGAVPSQYANLIDVAYFVCPVTPNSAAIDFSTWMAKYPALDAFQCTEIALVSPITLFNNNYDRVFVFLDGSVSFGTPSQSADVPLLHVGKSLDANVSYLSYNNAVSQLMTPAQRPTVSWWKDGPLTAANTVNTYVRMELAKVTNPVPSFYIFELVFTPTDIIIVYSDVFQNVVDDATFLLAYKGASYPIPHSAKRSYLLSTNDMPPHVFAGGRVLLDSSGITLANSFFRGDGGLLTNIQATAVVGNFSSEHVNLNGNGAGLYGIRSSNIAWTTDLVLPAPLVFTGNGAGLFDVVATAIDSANISWTTDLVLPDPLVFAGNGAGLYGVPGVFGDLTVDGLILSGKTGIVTGFGGGPRFSQGGWGAPGNVHTLAWSTLADGCDNVTGTLYVHVSSKGADQKNAMITASLVKNADMPPDLLVTSLHASSNVFTLEVGVEGDDVVVNTDDGCAVCWSFMAAC